MAARGCADDIPGLHLVASALRSHATGQWGEAVCRSGLVRESARISTSVCDAQIRLCRWALRAATFLVGGSLASLWQLAFPALTAFFNGQMSWCTTFQGMTVSR